MKQRVVITGMGVCAPNGVGLDAFKKAIQEGVSGITHHSVLKDLQFSCQVGGIPSISEEKKRSYFSELQLRNFNASGIMYGVISGIDATSVAIKGIEHDITSATGYSKPSYKELTIATELLAYSWAISSFVIPVLNVTLSLRFNFLINLSVCPPSLELPKTNNSISSKSLANAAIA